FRTFGAPSAVAARRDMVGRPSSLLPAPMDSASDWAMDMMAGSVAPLSWAARGASLGQLASGKRSQMPSSRPNPMPVIPTSVPASLSLVSAARTAPVLYGSQSPILSLSEGISPTPAKVFDA